MTETKDKINIIRAKYTASAVKKAQYPAERLKEIAFIGRSNVGKSSLINSLTRVHNLARVSGQPGKTQTINFFELTARIIETAKTSCFIWWICRATAMQKQRRRTASSGQNSLRNIF